MQAYKMSKLGQAVMERARLAKEAPTAAGKVRAMHNLARGAQLIRIGIRRS